MLTWLSGCRKGANLQGSAMKVRFWLSFMDVAVGIYVLMRQNIMWTTMLFYDCRANMYHPWKDQFSFLIFCFVCHFCRSPVVDGYAPCRFVCESWKTCWIK